MDGGREGGGFQGNTNSLTFLTDLVPFPVDFLQENVPYLKENVRYLGFPSFPYILDHCSGRKPTLPWLLLLSS